MLIQYTAERSSCIKGPHQAACRDEEPDALGVTGWEAIGVAHAQAKLRTACRPRHTQGLLQAVVEQLVCNESPQQCTVFDVPVLEQTCSNTIREQLVRAARHAPGVKALSHTSFVPDDVYTSRSEATSRALLWTAHLLVQLTPAWNTIENTGIRLQSAQPSCPSLYFTHVRCVCNNCVIGWSVIVHNQATAVGRIRLIACAARAGY